MTGKMEIATLAADLTAATEAYETAKSVESAARGKATDALNSLNAAQKAFDDAVATIKHAAPLDSDWKSRSNRVYAVEAA